MKASVFVLSIIAAVAAAQTAVVDDKPSPTVANNKPSPTVVGRAEAETTDVEE